MKDLGDNILTAFIILKGRRYGIVMASVCLSGYITPKLCIKSESYGHAIWHSLVFLKDDTNLKFSIL